MHIRESLKSRPSALAGGGLALADLARRRMQGRRSEVDRLGLRSAPPLDAGDVAAKPGDRGAQRLVAPRRGFDHGCDGVGLDDAGELAATFEHRLFSRRLAAGQPRLRVGQRRLEPVALASRALGVGFGRPLDIGQTQLERIAAHLQRCNFGALFLGQRFAVAELLFDPPALIVDIRERKLNRAKLAAQRVGVAPRRFKIAGVFVVDSSRATRRRNWRPISTLRIATASSAARNRRSSLTISIAC